MCGESNSIKVAYCHRCSYRLPWADEVEGIEHQSIEEQPSFLERELKEIGLLPDHTLTCRYCNKPIAVGAKQCPHCQRWLMASFSSLKLDPTQKNFRLRDVEKMDIMPIKVNFGEGLKILVGGCAFLSCLTIIYFVIRLIWP